MFCQPALAAASYAVVAAHHLLELLELIHLEVFTIWIGHPVKKMSNTTIGLLLGPLPLPGEGRALPREALPLGDGHVQREVQEGLQGE